MYILLGRLGTFRDVRTLYLKVWGDFRASSYEVELLFGNSFKLGVINVLTS